MQIIDLMNSSSARCEWGYKQSEYAGLGGKVSYPEMQINKLIQINTHNRHNIKLYISPHFFCQWHETGIFKTTGRTLEYEKKLSVKLSETTCNIISWKYWTISYPTYVVNAACQHLTYIIHFFCMSSMHLWKNLYVVNDHVKVHITKQMPRKKKCIDNAPILKRFTLGYPYWTKYFVNCSMLQSPVLILVTIAG